MCRYLSPADSLLVLDLDWLTVRTAEVADTVMHTWVAKLLTMPAVGRSSIRRHSCDGGSRIAELHHRLTFGETLPIAAWDNAARAARQDGAAAAIVDLTRHAIRSWRRLAGLSVVGEPNRAVLAA